MSDASVQPEVRLRPLRLLQALVAAACAGLAWWAFQPLVDLGDTPFLDGTTRASNTTPSTKPSLDVLAYAAPLWVAPPPPPAPIPAAAPPPPPPPLRLQLLAIVKEGDGYKALIYDPDADKLIRASTGERVGGQSISRIDATRVELQGQGLGTRTLALRTPTPGGSP